MLAFHASMPALSPAALRQFELLTCLLQATMGGAVGWWFGPRLPGAFVYLGGILAALFVAEVLLRRWARRRALPFIPRRDWRAAWRHAIRAAPMALIFVRPLLLGLAVAQVTQGRPAWAMSPQSWAGVAIFMAFLVPFGLWERGSAAADARDAAQRKAAPEPRQDAP